MLPPDLSLRFVASEAAEKSAGGRIGFLPAFLVLLLLCVIALVIVIILGIREHTLDEARHRACAADLKIILVTAHEIHHLIAHLLDVLIGDAHMLHIFSDLRDIQLFRADKAEPLIALFCTVHRCNEYHGRPFFAVAAHYHIAVSLRIAGDTLLSLL